MTTTPPHYACPARRRHALAPACLLFLTLGATAHAAGPAATNPLEAPPTLQADSDTGDGAVGSAGGRAGAGAMSAGLRNEAAGHRDASGLAPHADDPDWRVRLHLASPPGDRPSSATLAQRAVVVTMSRSF